MDQAVIRSIAKWPNVPAAYGWLSLDRRGDWFVKGERIASPAITGFIARNYAHDEAGRWFFQNGPQRVYVALEYTPYVLRTEPAGALPGLRAHTGAAVVDAGAAWLDEAGALLVECLGCVGLVHDRDLEGLLPLLHGAHGHVLADDELENWLGGAELDVALHLATGPVPVRRMHSARVASRFAFDPRPLPRAGEPEC